MISEQNEQQALWDALDYFNIIADKTSLSEEVENMERDRIANALEMHHGNRSRAAAELGIGRTLLIHKIKKYNL